MKRAVGIVVAISVTCMMTSNAWAWFGSKKKEAPAETAVSAPVKAAAEETKEVKKEAVKKIDKAREESQKAQKAQADKKRNELNNTEWQIDLTLLSGKGKKETETVVFKNNQVSFLNYAKKGFPTTNYTLTVSQDNMVVWETMQTAEKGGITFWRGEMDPSMQSFRGILSYQIDDKTKEDYSFVSTSKKVLPAAGN